MFILLLLFLTSTAIGPEGTYVPDTCQIHKVWDGSKFVFTSSCKSGNLKLEDIINEDD